MSIPVAPQYIKDFEHVWYGNLRQSCPCKNNNRTINLRWSGFNDKSIG